MERKIQKTYVDHGCGFPVAIQDVPMVKVRGAWTPDIDWNKLHNAVLHQLASKAGRLTGKEVAFIRHSFEMTLQGFAKRFDVSHPAILKWENRGHRPTKMSWAVEKDIRLFIIYQRFNKKGLIDLYRKLIDPQTDQKPTKPSLDYHKLLAA